MHVVHNAIRTVRTIRTVRFIRGTAAVPCIPSVYLGLQSTQLLVHLYGLGWRLRIRR